MARSSSSKPGFRRPIFSRRPQRPRPLLKEPPKPQRVQSEDEKLDEALQETFPASDPAVSTPRKS
jgi:hypothetical protein